MDFDAIITERPNGQEAVDGRLFRLLSATPSSPLSTSVVEQCGGFSAVIKELAEYGLKIVRVNPRKQNAYFVLPILDENGQQNEEAINRLSCVLGDQETGQEVVYFGHQARLSIVFGKDQDKPLTYAEARDAFTVISGVRLGDEEELSFRHRRYLLEKSGGVVNLGNMYLLGDLNCFGALVLIEMLTINHQGILNIAGDKISVPDQAVFLNAGKILSPHKIIFPPADLPANRLSAITDVFGFITDLIKQQENATEEFDEFNKSFPEIGSIIFMFKSLIESGRLSHKPEDFLASLTLNSGTRVHVDKAGLVEPVPMVSEE